MKTTLLVSLAAALLAPAFANADFLAVNLSGTTDTGSWTGLNSSNYTTEDGYNGYMTNTNAWPSPIISNGQGDTTSAVFDKTPGYGGFPSTTSIYTGFAPGLFTVSDANPVSNLSTIVFQIDYVYDSTNSAPPVITLNYNNGDQGLVAGLTATTAGGYTGSNGDTTLGIYQWDLSSIEDPISSYSISISSEAGSHFSIYAMKLDTSDTYSAIAVPEPSTYAALAGLAVLGFVMLRRRKLSQK